MTEAPESHPKPREWWYHVLIAMYLGMAGMAGEAALAVMTDGEQGAAAVIRALAWAALATTYGAASTLIGAIKAWRGHD